MARGLIAGVVCGAVVAVTGAAAVSLYVGAPEEGMVQVSDADADSAPLDKGYVPADPVSSPEIAEAPRVAPEPEEVQPDAVMPPEAALPDTPPLRYEDAAQHPVVVESPAAPALRPGDEAAIALPGTSALDMPEGALPDAPAADTAPASVPDAGQDSASLTAPTSPDSTGDVSVATEAPVMPTIQGMGPAAPQPEQEPSVTTEPAQPPVPQVPQERSGLVVADVETEGAPTLPMVDSAPEPETEETMPEVTVLVPDASRPAIGTPGVSLLERNGESRRLPNVNAQSGASATREGPERALSLYSASIDVPDDLPLMAIVLIDNPDGPLGPDALDDFPFPLTFAIDPSSPGASARMRGYRAQGFEVVVMGAVPEGAQASDVEVALAASLSSVPESVAVLEPPQGGLQSSRQVSDQVTQVLRDSGHGLVLMPNGLNTAQALATREGVPAATVFRDFDGEGQDARTIRRFLDGAAFRARQNGNVIMLGRLRADTLSALLLWGLQDRASQVALVPVSMVLEAANEPAD